MPRFRLLPPLLAAFVLGGAAAFAAAAMETEKPAATDKPLYQYTEAEVIVQGATEGTRLIGNAIRRRSGKFGILIQPEILGLAMEGNTVSPGGAGAIEVVMTGDTVPVTLAAVPVGTMLELSVTQVISASTTATLLIGLY